MSGQIFISYRREESRWSARSLHDRLTQRFDRKQIFMDVDSVGLGEDFVKTIEETVGSCDVLIAVIGAHWLTSTDAQGGRRLDNPEDFVRTEIATALRRHIRVIPVLVDGASMPQSADLPDDLKPLVRRNALLVGDTHFDDDCRRLMAAIEQVLDKAAAERREREEKERLEHEPQSPPPSPVAPSIPPANREANKPPVEIPKVVYPLAPKPAESERERPPPPSSGRIGGKTPSKQVVIAFLAIVAVLVVGGLIYLAIRPSQSPRSQPAPPSASPSQAVIATPTPAPMSSSPGGVALPSPSINVTPPTALPTSAPEPSSSTPVPNTSAMTWQIGNRVLALWSDDYWYAATINDIRGKRLLVHYDDGTKEWLTAEKIIALDYRVGDYVECRSKGRKDYYPAHIVDTEGDNITVQYSDSSKEQTSMRLLRFIK